MVGALLGVQPGESLRLVGRWSSHPKYGRQFEVDLFTTVLPALLLFLWVGSGALRSVRGRSSQVSRVGAAHCCAAPP